jgi:hypothetical protein
MTYFPVFFAPTLQLFKYPGTVWFQAFSVLLIYMAQVSFIWATTRLGLTPFL